MGGPFRGFRQLLLLHFKIAQISVVHLADAVDSNARREHEPKLSQRGTHDPNITLPMKNALAQIRA